MVPESAKAPKPHTAGMACCLMRMSARVLPTILFASLLAACSGTGRNVAAACRITRLARLPITIVHNWPVVSVRINGHTARMLVDTGSSATIIDRRAMGRFGLRLYPQAIMESGLGGATNVKFVNYNTFEVGSIHSAAWDFGGNKILATLNMPFPTLSKPLDGILGADFLSAFDIDLNIPHHRITVYRVRNCSGTFVPWKGPIDTISIRRTPGNSLLLPVRLDGHEIAAEFDTGSVMTVVKMSTARAIGITSAMLKPVAGKYVTGVDGNKIPIKLHAFNTIQIGRSVFRNLPIVVMPAHLNGISAQTMQPPKMLLGAGYLANHQVWLSYRTWRIFVRQVPVDKPVAIMGPLWK
ncbi:MAG TPA: retroviral-like aspartic protease family protein [Acetobacteraceae bacterium]|nr:retroviral-like aspartic protease family protein [Acetobacteraceae bacterium]